MVLPLIGLVGRARSGKNTAARMLRRHGYSTAAFADPLRAFVEAVNPIVVTAADPREEPVRYCDALDTFGYEHAKDFFPEVRRVLQVTGTEGVRNVLGDRFGLRELLGDDLWVVLGGLRVDKAKAAGVPLAFTDVRFPNEADLVRDRGGVVVRVTRAGLPTPEVLHASETALDDYVADFTLTNDGTLDDLREAVRELVGKL